MLKKNQLKIVSLTGFACFILASCSRKDDVQPVETTLQPSQEMQSLASVSSTSKISISGSSLQLGISGHPLGDAPYIKTPPTKQIQLIKGMGMNWYRVDVQTTSDGTVTVPYLFEPLREAAAAGKVNILPMLYTRTLDLSASTSAAYKAGKTIGSNFAAKYGQYFTYYELGNDLELKLLLPNKTGASQDDYDRAKFNVVASYLKGMDEGIKSKDAGAKTMIAAGWLHYGFLRMLDWSGVKFDVVAYHWYSEMEAIAPNSPTNIPDITKKLSTLFPDKPIWFTEINQRYKNTSTYEKDQNAFLSKFITKCKNNPQVKVAIIYELFNEPQKSSALEANYGIIKWTTPYTVWLKKLVANNLTL